MTGQARDAAEQEREAGAQALRRAEWGAREADRRAAEGRAALDSLEQVAAAAARWCRRPLMWSGSYAL